MVDRRGDRVAKRDAIAAADDTVSAEGREPKRASLRHAYRLPARRAVPGKVDIFNA